MSWPYRLVEIIYRMNGLPSNLTASVLADFRFNRLCHVFRPLCELETYVYQE